MKKLIANKEIHQPIYSYHTHSRTGDYTVVKPRKVIIVEGILIFTNKELLDLFDIKIFVHADPDDRLMRRIKRDISERGRSIDSVMDQYTKVLKPMHQQFIEPTKAFADIIIPNNDQHNVAVDIIKTVIKNKIES